MQTPNLDRYCAKALDFLGARYAILGGAMSWISERNLVSAISNAGGFGVIAGSSMSPDILRAEIHATRGMTGKPFGINIITMHPQMDDLVEMLIDEHVSHVVLAGGLPKTAHIKRLKEGGVRVICFAPAVAIAKKLLRSGADALVIEGNEAGGHIGPVATSVLAQEILPFMRANHPDIPVFIAGGIGTAEAIAAYLRMGASGVQMGTRFVCTQECIAHPDFKRAFIKAQARDAVTSVQMFDDLPVIPVRAISNQATREFEQAQRDAARKLAAGEIGKEEAQLEIEHYWAGSLRRAVIDGDITHGSLMAGQSVAFVKEEQPVADIINSLTTQTEVLL